MPTIAELINANPEKVQELLDSTRAAEETRRAAAKATALAEEAAKGQRALQASELISSEPSEFANRKAQALAKQAKAAIGEAGEGVISDLPQISGKMSSATERAARAAAGTVGEGVIELAGPIEDNALLSRMAPLAEKGASVFEKLGLSPGAIDSLKKAAGRVAKGASKLSLPLAVASEVALTPEGNQNSDVVTGKQLTPLEMMNTLPGVPVSYSAPGDSSKLNLPMASSLYDSSEQIVMDANRPPFRKPSSPEVPLSPERSVLRPRTNSAGEPTAEMVQKQSEDAALTNLLQQGKRGASEYEDLLNRYKDAQERQRLAQLGISLGQAGEKIGSAIAMTKPEDQSFYEQQMKLASGFADQVKEEEEVRREAEKNDPNSPISKEYRDLVQSMDIKLKGTETAASLIKSMPFLQQYQSRKEAAKLEAKREAERRADKEEARLRREELQLTEDQNKYLDRGQRDFQRDKTQEAYLELKRGLQQIDDYLKNPNPVKAGAISTYLYGKINDPTSAIREQEQKLFGKAGSIRDQIQQMVSLAATGNIPEKKAIQFKNLINDKLQGYESSIKQKLSSVIKGGERYKLSPEQVVSNLAGPEMWETLFKSKPVSAEESKTKETIKLPQKQTGKAGKTIVSKDGKRYVINADETTATEI